MSFAFSFSYSHRVGFKMFYLTNLSSILLIHSTIVVGTTTKNHVPILCSLVDGYGPRFDDLVNEYFSTSFGDQGIRYLQSIQHRAIQYSKRRNDLQKQTPDDHSGACLGENLKQALEQARFAPPTPHSFSSGALNFAADISSILVHAAKAPLHWIREHSVSTSISPEYGAISKEIEEIVNLSDQQQRPYRLHRLLAILDYMQTHEWMLPPNCDANSIQFFNRFPSRDVNTKGEAYGINGLVNYRNLISRLPVKPYRVIYHSLNIIANFAKYSFDKDADLNISLYNFLQLGINHIASFRKDSAPFKIMLQLILHLEELTGDEQGYSPTLPYWANEVKERLEGYQNRVLALFNVPPTHSLSIMNSLSQFEHSQVVRSDQHEAYLNVARESISVIIGLGSDKYKDHSELIGQFCLGLSQANVFVTSHDFPHAFEAIQGQLQAVASICSQSRTQIIEKAVCHKTNEIIKTIPKQPIAVAHSFPSPLLEKPTDFNAATVKAKNLFGSDALVSLNFKKTVFQYFRNIFGDSGVVYLTRFNLLDLSSVSKELKIAVKEEADRIATTGGYKALFDILRYRIHRFLGLLEYLNHNKSLPSGRSPDWLNFDHLYLPPVLDDAKEFERAKKAVDSGQENLHNELKGAKKAVYDGLNNLHYIMEIRHDPREYVDADIVLPSFEIIARLGQFGLDTDSDASKKTFDFLYAAIRHYRSFGSPDKNSPAQRANQRVLSGFLREFLQSNDIESFNKRLTMYFDRMNDFFGREPNKNSAMNKLVPVSTQLTDWEYRFRLIRDYLVHVVAGSVINRVMSRILHLMNNLSLHNALETLGNIVCSIVSNRPLPQSIEAEYKGVIEANIDDCAR